MPAVPDLKSRLDNYRTSPEPAWLWDGSRCRIVWANPPAVTLFEGASLFDVIDRQFDSEDAAIQTLTETQATLQAGEIASVILDLTWLPTGTMASATVVPHDLADGRKGLLVRLEPPEKETPLDPGALEAAYRALPLAVALLTEDGTLHHGNPAFKTVCPNHHPQLSSMLADHARADRHLSQIKSRNLISTIEQANTSLGVRDLRVTLRKIEHPDYIAVATFEDVTDRRQIEREWSEQTNSPAVPQLSKGAAFEKLAESLKDTINSSKAAELPAPTKTVAPEKSEKQSPPLTRKPPHVAIPETIRRAMERSGEAVAILRDNKILFATIQAVEDYNLIPGSMDATTTHEELFNLRGPISSIVLPHTSKGNVDVDISVKSVPWQDGPARQLIIRLAQPSKPREVLVSTDVSPTADSPITTTQTRMVTRIPTNSAQITLSRATASVESDQHETPTAQLQETTPDDELKAILDVASDGIISLDADGKILSYSAGAEAIFGHRVQEVIGKPMGNLLAMDSRKTWVDYLAALQGPGLASVFNDGREVTALVKQGGTVPLFLTLGRLQSTKSKARFCAVVRDITQWKRTEQELRSAKDQAEESNRQKSIFLAHISHELRTPLNAIMGFSEVMQQEKLGRIANEKYRNYAGDIHASGKHLLSLIDDLLDLSRIEAGKLDLDFVAVNIAEIVEHATRMLQGEASARNVVLRSSFAKGLPQIVADQRSMRQVLLNLVSNAIKFTEAGGQIIISAMSKSDGSLVLRVKDTGIGMSTDQMKSALEPFKRIATEGRETKGTGLGLPLAKALIEANRATLVLSSEPGQGTLAEITFPTNRVLAD